MRLLLLLAALTAALGLAVLTTQTPRPGPASAPAGGFSARRGMVHVRRIAAVPHPVGTVEHALVQAYLVGRRAELGLEPTRAAVERNMETVPRSTLPDVRVEDGDDFEIVTFVGGG